MNGQYYLKEPMYQVWQTALKPLRKEKLEARWNLLDQDTRRRLSADPFISGTFNEYGAGAMLAADLPDINAW